MKEEETSRRGLGGESVDRERAQVYDAGRCFRSVGAMVEGYNFKKNHCIKKIKEREPAQPQGDTKHCVRGAARGRGLGVEDMVLYLRPLTLTLTLT